MIVTNCCGKIPAQNVTRRNSATSSAWIWGEIRLHSTKDLLKRNVSLDFHPASSGDTECELNIFSMARSKAQKMVGGLKKQTSQQEQQSGEGCIVRQWQF
ncbi:MAG: hypothetical protein GY820_06080 [Gammaproteobacteria bacterium]|nr:hypothetical protein [Gammaproteobacteria bacterium]